MCLAECDQAQDERSRAALVAILGKRGELDVSLARHGVYVEPVVAGGYVTDVRYTSPRHPWNPEYCYHVTETIDIVHRDG